MLKAPHQVSSLVLLLAIVGQGCNDGGALEESAMGAGLTAAKVRDSAPPPVVVSKPAEPISMDEYNKLLTSWRLEPDNKQELQRLAGYNLVLVVVDGLRGDLLQPLSASRRALYPHLSGLLQRSRRFSTAFSSAAGTDVGMTAMLTGRLHYLYRGRQTLARAMRSAGVRTHGVYQTEVERWLGASMCRQGHRGRRVLVNDPLKQDFGSRATSRQVTNEGIRFLRRHGSQRFFLWLHYFDVHEHHQIQLKTLSMPGWPGEAEAPKPQPLRGRYELMLRHVDHHVGRFLSALEEQGLADNTIVVFTSDHGEGLSESPRLPAMHGERLYQPLVHVPLAVRLPKVKGQRLHTPVSIADVYPTLLDLAGISAPSRRDSISLLPFLLRDKPAPFDRLSRSIFLMESHQQALVQWPLKLIVWQDREEVELYDLANDPSEKDDLSSARPALVQRMTTLLRERGLHRVDRRRSYVRSLLRERAKARREARKRQQ